MEGTAKYNCCLVGGTFDRFHAGHRLLLKAAKHASKRIEIHITSDSMAGEKSPHIQSFEDRQDVLLKWIDSNALGRATVHELTDKVGPAPSHPDADCIVATAETHGQCESINDLRVQAGLKPLHIIQVSHLKSIEGGIISSSNIRNGLMDQEGHPWMSDEHRTLTYIMHSGLDADLKTPMGVLFEGPETSPDVAMYAALDGLDLSVSNLIAVGDVSVATLLDMGCTPDMGLIDGQTKRTPLSSDEQVDPSTFGSILHATNPPGQLTPSLLQALEEGLAASNTVLIHVEGEEDLAPLFIHLLAPLGTYVVYGQPHRGVVLQQTTLDVKKRCRNLVAKFEVE